MKVRFDLPPLDELRERDRAACAKRGLSPEEDLDRLAAATPEARAYFDELKRLYGLPVNQSLEPAP